MNSPSKEASYRLLDEDNDVEPPLFRTLRTWPLTPLSVWWAVVVVQTLLIVGLVWGFIIMPSISSTQIPYLYCRLSICLQFVPFTKYPAQRLRGMPLNMKLRASYLVLETSYHHFNDHHLLNLTRCGKICIHVSPAFICAFRDS
jgi:hypothetical protein